MEAYKDNHLVNAQQQKYWESLIKEITKLARICTEGNLYVVDVATHIYIKHTGIIYTYLWVYAYAHIHVM